jgi:ABC-type sugar transport systems, permease components
MQHNKEEISLPPSLSGPVALKKLPERPIPVTGVPVSSSETAERQKGNVIVHKQIKHHQNVVALIGGLFVLPGILGFLVYNVAPTLFGLYISFTKYEGFGNPVWSGLRNYIYLVHDQAFWHSLVVTLLLAVFIVPLSLIVPMILALLLNEKLPLQGLLRVVFFLPSAVPWVATALLFQDMFLSNGLYNEILHLFHQSPQDWIYATSSNLLGPLFWLIVILCVWKSYGLSMLIYLAGLQGIPRAHYEAAMIEGAGPWQRFLAITLPGLAPVTFFVLITSVIAALQTFTPVLLLGGQQSAVNGATVGGGIQTISVYAYDTAFVGGIYGYGSALLWGMFVVMFAFTLIQFRLLQRGTRRKESLA